MTLDNISTKSKLEKIAQEVNAMPKDCSKDEAWGPCGYIAKEIAKRLRKTYPENMIKIYTFSNGRHTVATLGNSNHFDNLWKIDLEKEQKFVYAPKEPYAIDWVKPELVNDKYFAIEVK